MRNLCNTAKQIVHVVEINLNGGVVSQKQTHRHSKLYKRKITHHKAVSFIGATVSARGGNGSLWQRVRVKP